MGRSGGGNGSLRGGAATLPDGRASRAGRQGGGHPVARPGRGFGGESQEELDRWSEEDRRLARQGLVKLEVGEEIPYKHLDDLTREDRSSRIAAEREEIDWPDQ